MPEMLIVSRIRIDGGTQPRAALNTEVIAEYAEAMANQVHFPPVVVFYDGAEYWLADGFHRYFAAQKYGKPFIEAEIRQGTLQEAQWYSYSVNQSHGLRRTNEDKRRAVEAALRHPYAGQQGIRGVARHCGVSEGFVHKLWHVPSVHGEQIEPTRLVTRNGATYTMNTANIGRREVEAPKPMWEVAPEIVAEPCPPATEQPTIIIAHNEQEVLDIARSIRAQRREEQRETVKAALENIATKEAKALVGVYDVIVIDPPWPMTKIERDERPNQVEFDYPTMTLEEIAEINLPCADDCHVWLWTTHKYLPDSMNLLTHWGLRYVCAFVWHKPGGFQPYGLPQFNCEFALYARRGAPVFLDTKAFPTCFTAERAGHSVKPQEFYDTVARVTAGRRLDMFNRRPIDGFDTWGNEA